MTDDRNPPPDAPEPVRFVDGVLGPMHPLVPRPTPRERLWLHCAARKARERAQRKGP